MPNWIGIWRSPYIELPVRQPEGWLVLALYILGGLALIMGQRRTFAHLGGRRWIVFFLLLGLAVWLNNFLPYPVSTYSPMPDQPQETPAMFVPLLGLAPVLLAGIWLGIGPAMVVGAVAGLVRAAFVTAWATQIAEPMVFGVLAGFLARQEYRGRLFALLRQPLAAGLIGACASWLFVLPSLYLYAQGAALYALDYSWSLFLAAFLPTLLTGLLAGSICQGLYLSFPSLRPVRSALTPPPFARGLAHRLLFIFVPGIFWVIGLLLYAVTATALQAATRQAIAQMSRDAASSTGNVAYFFQTGQSLMDSFAAD